MNKLDHLLLAIRAAGDETRLRLLAILSRGEFPVTELAQIIGQSQPRVSRHLKLLADAGLVSRYQEGAWVFYRRAEVGEGGDLAATIVERIPATDWNVRQDVERLKVLRERNVEKARRYFEINAREWDRIRGMYVPEDAVDRTILGLVGGAPIDELLDIGTGTGRVLELLAPLARRALGIDNSREMLAVARAKLGAPEFRHCRVRLADLYDLPLAPGTFSVVTLHHVLHFLDDPAGAIREAARMLTHRGLLILVDFAPHRVEMLRTEYAHRRLGFSHRDISSWCRQAGLTKPSVRHLRPEARDRTADQLVVSVWGARQTRNAITELDREVAHA
jgi:ubiquinone/menaquinone biosynthesis C-methylase UbiE